MSEKDQPIGAVRAKMQCQVVENYSTSSKVKMGALYSQDTSENADFAKATPSGEIWMQISKDVPASGWFEPGEAYYVTFTKAPKK